MALPWLFRMRWLDLLFAHWPVDASQLTAHLPGGLELDLFEGQAWLGIVPFTMADVAPRGVPAVPRLSTFPEINVRTYVRHRGEAGVWFLSLDAASRAIVEGGRRVFGVPYLRAKMASLRDAPPIRDEPPIRDGPTIRYRSRRTDRRGRPARFEGTFRPTGPPAGAAPGSLDAWLTDRMRLFSTDRQGRIRRTRIAHASWQLQPARAEIDVNTMAAAHGIVLPDRPPRLLFAERLDVRAWLPERAD